MWNKLNSLILLILITAFAALVSGCSDEDANGQTAAATPPPPVKAVTVASGDVSLVYEYPARVEGSREVDVRAQVGGILVERTYEEGSFVRAGDVLFRIAPDTYSAGLDQAQGELERLRATEDLARLQRERIEALYERGAVSTQERDDAVSSHEAAKAAVHAAGGALRQARISLGYTEVTAPISGITSKEARSEGSLITAGSTDSLLTTITCLDPVYVNFSVPGTELLKRRRMRQQGLLTVPEEGITVQLRLADGSLYEHSGRINFTDKQEDPATGTVRMRAQVANPDGLVLPGGFVRVVLSGAALKDAVVVPQRAVMFTQQATLVFVLGEGDVPQARPVRLGETVGDGFQILDGLRPGERIVSEGLMQIHPGAPVTVLPDQSAADAASSSEVDA